MYFLTKRTDSKLLTFQADASPSAPVSGSSSRQDQTPMIEKKSERERERHFAKFRQPYGVLILFPKLRHQNFEIVRRIINPMNFTYRHPTVFSQFTHSRDDKCSHAEEFVELKLKPFKDYSRFTKCFTCVLQQHL